MKDKNRRPAHQAITFLCLVLADRFSGALNPDVQVGQARTVGPETESAADYLEKGWPVENTEFTGSVEVGEVINLGTATQANAVDPADIMGQMIEACDREFLEKNETSLTLDFGEQVLTITPFIEGSDDVPGDPVYFKTTLKFTATQKAN